MHCFLTLSRRRPISYGNQSIDLLCKSMDWFPYDIGLRHERVNYFTGLKLSIKTNSSLVILMMPQPRNCNLGSRRPQILQFFAGVPQNEDLLCPPLYRQLGSGINPQSCLYFHGFLGSELLNGCLVV